MLPMLRAVLLLDGLVGWGKQLLPERAARLRSTKGWTALDLESAGLVERFEDRLLTFQCRGQSNVADGSQANASARSNLTFIHIPRNAGSSIEDCTEGEQQRWGAKERVLQGFGYHCSLHHVPPNLVPFYYRGREDTFCVVRNPYERMISEFHFPNSRGFSERAAAHRCTAEGLNSFALEALGRWQSDPWVNDCHVLPQAAYVYAWDASKHVVVQGRQSCKHVLRQENLTAEFNSLMAAHGYAFRLTSQRNPNTIAGPSWGCAHVTPDDFEPEAIKLINKVWGDDFRLLGYEMK